MDALTTGTLCCRPDWSLACFSDDDNELVTATVHAVQKVLGKSVIHDPRVKIGAPFLLPPSGSSCSVERLVFFSSSRLTYAVCVKVLGVPREGRRWQSYFTTLLWRCGVVL